MTTLFYIGLDGKEHSIPVDGTLRVDTYHIPWDKVTRVEQVSDEYIDKAVEQILKDQEAAKNWGKEGR